MQLLTALKSNLRRWVRRNNFCYPTAIGGIEENILFGAMTPAYTLTAMTTSVSAQSTDIGLTQGWTSPYFLHATSQTYALTGTITTVYATVPILLAPLSLSCAMTNTDPGAGIYCLACDASTVSVTRYSAGLTGISGRQIQATTRAVAITANSAALSAPTARLLVTVATTGITTRTASLLVSPRTWSLSSGTFTSTTRRAALRFSVSHFVPRGNCTVTNGNVITKTLTTGWDGDCSSSVALSDGARIAFTVAQGSTTFTVGFSSAPLSGYTATSTKYAFNISGTYINVFVDGIMLGQFGNLGTGDVLEIIYDGGHVFFIQNGTMIFRLPDGALGVPNVPTGQQLYFDADFYTVGTSIINCHFGLTDAPELVGDTTSVVVTVNASLLRRNRKLTATTQSVGVTGVTIGFRNGVSVVCTNRAIQIATISAVFTHNHPLTAQTKTVGIASSSAGLMPSKGFIQVTTSSLGVNGISASLSAGRRLTTTVAGISIVGKQSILANSPRLGCTASSLSVSTATAAFTSSRRLTASTVPLGITVLPWASRKGARVTGTAQAVSFSGVTVAFLYARQLTCTPRSVAATALPGNLTNGHSLVSTSRAVAISGSSANANASRRLTGTTRAVALNHTVTTLLKGGAAFTVTTRTVGITPHTVTIRRTANLTATTATVALTPPSTSFGRNTNLAGQSRAVSVTGTAAGLSPYRSCVALPSNVVATIIPASMRVAFGLSTAWATLASDQGQADLTRMRWVTAIPLAARIITFPAYQTATGEGVAVTLGGAPSVFSSTAERQVFYLSADRHVFMLSWERATFLTRLQEAA